MTDLAHLSGTLLRDDVPDAFMELAVEVAATASRVAIRYYRTDFGADSKADDSPVTVADREAEAGMRALISERFPDHGILGEEHGSEALDARYVWVLDPIDGTIAFAAGYPAFGSLVALLENGAPVIGIIDAPATGDRWIGVRGQPATLNGEPVRCRPCPSLGGAWNATSSPMLFDTDEQKRAFKRLTENFGRRQIYSTNCLGYGLLASGHIDVVCEAGLGAYDVMAAVPVIEGAGGRITDWSGNALTLDFDGTAVATGDPAIHDEALALLAG